MLLIYKSSLAIPLILELKDITFFFVLNSHIVLQQSDPIVKRILSPFNLARMFSLDANATSPLQTSTAHAD